MIQIKPAGHRVLVEVEKVEEKSKGGLFLPETARERQQNATTTGIVLAVGPNAWKSFDGGEPWAKVGDKVIFAQYGGMVQRDPDGKRDLRILNDEDVVAVLAEG